MDLVTGSIFVITVIDQNYMQHVIFHPALFFKPNVTYIRRGIQ